MKTSRNEDIESEVAGYQAFMSQLARILHRYTARALDSLQEDIRGMMERGFYDPKTSVVFINSQADSTTIKRIEELVGQVPKGMRKRAWNEVLSKIVTGKMTNRNAIRTVSRLSLWTMIDSMVTSSARILDEVTVDGYLHGMYMMQKTAGVGWPTDALKQGRMQIIVHHVLTQSEARKFLTVAADMASDEVLYQMLKGSKERDVLTGMEKSKTASVYRSKREARTKLTEAANEAHMEAYREHGVKMYRFVATYDERTCPICGSLDGKKFPISEAMAGKNYPPMHPNCRCTTVAVMSKEIEEKMANPDFYDRSTNQYVPVPRDFNYEQWYKTFGPGRTDGIEYKPKYRKK